MIGVLNSEVRKNREGFYNETRVVYENENGTSGMRVEINTAISFMHAGATVKFMSLSGCIHLAVEMIVWRAVVHRYTSLRYE